VHFGSAALRPRDRGRRNVGRGEIGAFVEQRRIQRLGVRIGEAVAEVEPSRVPALAEARGSVGGEVGVAR
jgi:hypothetical protein